MASNICVYSGSLVMLDADAGPRREASPRAGRKEPSNTVGVDAGAECYFCADHPTSYHDPWGGSMDLHGTEISRVYIDPQISRVCSKFRTFAPNFAHSRSCLSHKSHVTRMQVSQLSFVPCPHATPAPAPTNLEIQANPHEPTPHPRLFVCWLRSERGLGLAHSSSTSTACCRNS